MDKKYVAIPLICAIMPISVFAKTSYTTSNAEVVDEETYTEDTSQKCDVSVIQASSFSVKIPKVITLDGSVGKENKATYEISVSGNIASDEVISVAPSSTTFNFTDVKGKKNPISASITQDITKFINNEVTPSDTKTTTTIDPTKGTTIEGTVSVQNLTSGEWEGNFEFVISLGTA
jgi:hypothetical protein